MSSFGTLFRITTFGESHGKGVGVIVDNCPPGLKLSEEDVQIQLNRRRPGQSNLTTARAEADIVSIQSGVENGITLGTPISCFVANLDQRPGDYKDMKQVPRPSHADFTYEKKYGLKASSGGGRSSARETIGRVAGGSIAEKWLKDKYGVEIVAMVTSIGPVEMPKDKVLEWIPKVTRKDVDSTLVRCPDQEIAKEMTKIIEAAKEDKDSTGGVITCVIRNVPVGLGEPCFDKLEAKLAHAMLSIPATKGFEIGSGFEGSKLRGSKHNDPFVFKKELNRLGTVTNNSGGIQGGISNGETIYFRVAFKPAATIGQDQTTSDNEGNTSVLAAKGRHDPCVVPRAPSIVESMAALVIADAAMIQIARQGATMIYNTQEENEADMI